MQEKKEHGSEASERTRGLPDPPPEVVNITYMGRSGISETAPSGWRSIRNSKLKLSLHEGIYF
jgi:hypothetical protein